jgi:hypothetical protein
MLPSVLFDILNDVLNPDDLIVTYSPIKVNPKNGYMSKPLFHPNNLLPLSFKQIPIK